MKTDANGAIQWEASFGGSGDDVGHSFEELPSGGFIIDGRSASSDGDVSGNLGSKDYWVVKVDTTSTAIQSYSQNRHIKVHPNPFERSLTLQLPQEWREVDIALFDPQGRKVLERKGLKDDRFNVRADLGSGIYFLRVRTANGEQLRKVVKD